MVITDGQQHYLIILVQKINGVKVDLNIGDLIPVLRAAGDAIGNSRGLPPSGGDINVFSATVNDIKDCCYNGTNMDLKFF